MILCAFTRALILQQILRFTKFFTKSSANHGTGFFKNSPIRNRDQNPQGIHIDQHIDFNEIFHKLINSQPLKMLNFEHQKLSFCAAIHLVYSFLRRKGSNCDLFRRLLISEVGNKSTNQPHTFSTTPLFRTVFWAYLIFSGGESTSPGLSKLIKSIKIIELKRNYLISPYPLRLGRHI